MRISVVMAVNLGYYDVGFTHSASDSEKRFINAVNSFLNQSLKGSELIIISDGCEKAEKIYGEMFTRCLNVRFRGIDKQPIFSGTPRNMGIQTATGDVICYLDHDDAFGPNHLQIIHDNFDTSKHDWVWYNDYVVDTILAEKAERNVFPAMNVIGTSAIAHRKKAGVVWGDGYAHDFRMIEACLLPRPGIKIPTPEYYVCHFRKIEDL